MVTKTEKQKTKSSLREFHWLKDLPAWKKDVCVKFLKSNPNLPKDHEKVKKLESLSLENRMNIEANLEQNEDRICADISKGRAKREDWAYAAGALRAFSEGHYHCPLIYKFLAEKEIDALCY